MIKNRNDKILFLIISFILIILVLLFVVIYNIWNGNNSNNEISKYSYSGFEDTVVKMYQSQLERILRKSNAKILVSKLDDTYIKSIGLEKNDVEGIISYLNSKHLLSTAPKILDYKLSNNSETGICVYSFSYRTNGFKRKVHLIETEPYVYTISLEQDYTPTSARKSIVDSYNGIKFEISLQESTNNSLKYNAKITNNGEETVEFDFNNVSSVELKLDDGNKIKLSSVIITSQEDFVLPKNSYINQELFFSIPLDKQGNIKSLVFYNVLIGEKQVNLEIEF